MFLTLLSIALAAPPESITTYEHQRLFRSAYAIVDGAVTLTDVWDPKFAPTPWAVFDGSGNLLTAVEFAADVGDAGVQARLRKEERKTDTTNVVAWVAAVVAVSVGQGLGASGMPEPTTSMSPPDPRSALWQHLERDRPVFDYYTDAVADELILSHNASLRRSLGLTAEDVAAIERPPGH